MGTTGRVLWITVPELLHVGVVMAIVAVMVGIMGNTLFGFRAEAVSSLTGGHYTRSAMLKACLTTAKLCQCGGTWCVSLRHLWRVV